MAAVYATASATTRINRGRDADGSNPPGELAACRSVFAVLV